MLRGWLVVNHFLHLPKFEEIYQWLEAAADSRQISLRRFTNAQLLADMSGSHCIENYAASDPIRKYGMPDFILFWDKDTVLARFLENIGIRLFNRAEAIENCDNKILTHLMLASSGIPMPGTIAAPMTFDNIGYNDFSFLDSVMERFDFPIVVKAARGSFGKQVFKADSYQDLIDCVNNLGAQPVIFQEYISAAEGSDLRLQVVGDEVIAAMKRTSANNDFRSNLTLGGSMQAYLPSNRQIELALQACRTMKLDFAGVDLLIDEKGEPLVCEINSNAHFKTLYDCTGVDTAAAIMKYIMSWPGV
jgi:RimK family alpha-L-glutamate ligase